MAQIPGAVPSIETTTSGQLMSAVGHSDLHDQLADEITAAWTNIGVNPHQPATSAAAAPFATVKARLDAEVILRTTAAGLPGAASNVDRFAWQTDTRRLSIGTASGWEPLLAPDVLKYSTTNGRIGINQTAPGLTFHVHTLGSTSQPGVASSEIARFVSTVNSTSESVVSVIGGATGAAKLVLGDSGTLTRGSLELDASTGDVAIGAGGQRRLIMATDGGTVIRRDGSGPIFAQGAAVVLGLVRNYESGANATGSLVSGATGTAQWIFGTESVPQRGTIAYNNSTNAMSFVVAQANDAQLVLDSDGVSKFFRGPAGTSPAVSVSEVARFQHNTISTDGAAIAIIGGAGATSELRFGTATTATNLGKIIQDNTTNDLVFYTANSIAMTVTADGRCVVTRDGVGTGPAFTSGETFRVQANTSSASSVSASLISGATGNASLYFAIGSLAVNAKGAITYSQSIDEMRFIVNNIQGMRITHDAGTTPNVYAPGVYDHTGAGSGTVVIGTDGRMVRQTSALKYKDEVTPLLLSAARSIIEVAEPVAYRLKIDGSYRLGFIADPIADADERAGVYGATGNVEDFDTRAVLAAAVAMLRDHETRLTAAEA